MAAPSLTQTPPASAAPRPRVFDALREPRYRRLWLAGLCVNIARWLDFLVLGWLVLDLTGSPFMVGVAAFCRAIPILLLGSFTGVLADRFPRGNLMALAQGINLAAASVLLVLFGTGSGQVWQLVVLETAMGVAWIIDFPSRRTSFYALVGPGRLANAVSLDSISVQGTKMLGPALGGLLLARGGPAACYAALTGLYVVALLLMVSLNRQAALPRGGGATESVLSGLATGLREARRSPSILAVLFITVVANVLVLPYQQMLPVLARDVLRVGPELLGLLIAADGLGALIGGLWIASRRQITRPLELFTFGSLTAAVLVVGLALSPWLAASLPIQFAVGLANAGFGTMQSTIVLLRAPERARGRVMGVLSVCIGTQPLGSLWLGYAASEFGAPAAIAGCAATAAGLMLLAATRLKRPPRLP